MRSRLVGAMDMAMDIQDIIDKSRTSNAVQRDVPSQVHPFLLTQDVPIQIPHAYLSMPHDADANAPP